MAIVVESNGKEFQKKLSKRRRLLTKRFLIRALKRSRQKMKKRAKKRRASVIRDPPNTRRLLTKRSLSRALNRSRQKMKKRAKKRRASVIRDPPNTRKLKKFGRVIVLGDPSDPPLILVYNDGWSMELPHYVNDNEKKRIFARIFLLIGKNMHMTMCFPVAEESWLLYDNDPKKPFFQPFDVNILKDYIICLAGYVNVTQALEYKLGVAETGEGADSSKVCDEPFQQFYPQQSALDVDMEDLSFTNLVSIPETGEGVGTRPFYENQHDILPNSINQINAVEDVEMLSCSSCDSD